MVPKGEKFPFPTLSRVALSSLCTFLGWSCALLGDVLLQIWTGFGYVTDWEPTVFWTGLFVFIGWVIVVIPVVVFLDHRLWMFRFPGHMLFGAGAGLGAFVIVSTILGYRGLWTVSLFLVFAGVVGVVMMASYVAFLNIPFVRRWAHRPVSFVAGLLLFPPAAWLASQFLLWPGLEKFCPGVVCRYGPLEVRSRIEERVIRELKVGDRIQDLKAKTPRLFESLRGAEVFSGSRGDDNFSYRIVVKDGKVAAVEITSDK